LIHTEKKIASQLMVSIYTLNGPILRTPVDNLIPVEHLIILMITNTLSVLCLYIESKYFVLVEAS